MDIGKMIDSHAFVFAIIFLTFIIPMLSPIGLPMTVSAYVKKTYDFMQTVPEGSNVLMFPDFQIGILPELGPAYMAIFRYCMKRNMKVIMMEYNYQFGGSIQAAQIIDEVKAKGELQNKVYGVDYVHLGWHAGWEAGMALMAADFKKNINPVDYYGNPTQGMKILEPIKSIKDFPMLVLITSMGAGTQPEVALRQFQVPYGSKLIYGGCAQFIPLVVPYFTSGQLAGLLPSLSGGAELEYLTGLKAKGLAATDVMTFTHFALIGLLILGNIRYLSRRYVKKSK